LLGPNGAGKTTTVRMLCCLISLGTNNLLIIAVALALVDLVLFRISTATFRREEILTKWK